MSNTNDLTSDSEVNSAPNSTLSSTSSLTNSMITMNNQQSNSNSSSFVPEFIITPNECYRKKGLYQHHYDECVRRGLSHDVIALLVSLGVLQSFTIKQSNKYYSLPNFPTVIDDEPVGDVLVMKFGKNFCQIKPDREIYRNGKRLKYLSPTRVKAEAWYPQGFSDTSKLHVITEGMFDALIGTYVGGIPTAALAGVSHYQKVVRQDLKANILFDNDGISNPSVIGALYVAGKYSGNKIQTIPAIPGHPKAGLEEYFKFGGATAEDYKELISNAMTPLRFLYHVINSELPEDERRHRIVKQICLLAIRHEKQDDAFALLDHACKKAKIPAERKKGIRRQMLSDLALQQRIKAKQKKEREIAAPILKKDSDLYREAEALLDSGKFFEKVDELINKAGVVLLNNHIKLDLIGTIGVITDNKEQLVHIKYAAKSGQGKSVAQDIKFELMPEENVIDVGAMTLAYLKRIGSGFKNKQLVIDEMTSVFVGVEIISFFKMVLSKGFGTVFMTEAVDGKHEPIEMIVEGPISISMCSTEQTQQQTLGAHEDEVLDRCLQIVLPSELEYTKALNRQAIRGGKPKKIAEVDSHALEVIREAIRIAMTRPTPKFAPGFMDCFCQLANVEIESISRFFNNLRALLLNCTALLGKSEVDIEAYKIIFPLLSIIAQNKTTSSNPENYNLLKKLAEFEYRQKGTCGRMVMTAINLKEAFACGKTAAYNKLESLVQAGWLSEAEHRGKYTISTSGKDAIEKGLTLTQIIPTPESLEKLHYLVRNYTEKFHPFPPNSTLQVENENPYTEQVIDYIYNNFYNIPPIPENMCAQVFPEPPTFKESSEIEEIKDVPPRFSEQVEKLPEIEIKPLQDNVLTNSAGGWNKVELGGKTTKQVELAEEEKQTLSKNNQVIRIGDTVTYDDPINGKRSKENVLDIMKAENGNVSEDRLKLGKAALLLTQFEVLAIHVFKPRKLS